MQVLLSTLGQSYAATAARSEGIILHIKLTTSCTQPRNRCTAHQWKPRLSSAHEEDGRGTWAWCKGRSSSESTMQRHHVTLCHACSNRNNTGGSVFRPLYTRRNGRTLSNVFGMLLVYQSPFFGTPDNSWAPGKHTREEWDSKTGVKENYSDSLKRRVHWRSHTAQICTGLFWQRQPHLRDLFSRWVKKRNLSIHGKSGWPMPSFAAMLATSMNDFFSFAQMNRQPSWPLDKDTVRVCFATPISLQILNEQTRCFVAGSCERDLCSLLFQNGSSGPEPASLDNIIAKPQEKSSWCRDSLLWCERCH